MSRHGIDELYLPEDQQGRLWDQSLKELGAFKAKHGHVKVPRSCRTLNNWIRKQRWMVRHGKMSADRVEKLERIGVSLAWNVAESQEDVWEKRLKELAKFKAKHGHTNVPWAGSTFTLNKWVNRQRCMFREGKMPADRVKRLQGILVFLPQQTQNAGKRKRGDESDDAEGTDDALLEPEKLQQKKIRTCRRQSLVLEEVPSSTTALSCHELVLTSNKVGNPCSSSNNKREDDTTSNENLRSHQQQLWERQFAALLVYKKEFGDTDVSSRYMNAQGNTLGRWVRSQRQNYKRKDKKMPNERIDRLKAIGFVWVSGRRNSNIKGKNDSVNQSFDDSNNYKAKHVQQHHQQQQQQKQTQKFVAGSLLVTSFLGAVLYILHHVATNQKCVP